MMDQYLKPGLALARLQREWEKHGSIVVGFDFDSTVFDFHKSGESYEMVRQLLRDLKGVGTKLICWTANREVDHVKSFLEENNIPCDGINTDGIYLGWSCRKPYFSALLDDRAGLREVYDMLVAFVNWVKYIQLGKELDPNNK